MKSEWKTLCDKAENLVVTPAFILAIPWLSPAEKILLQVLAKNKDGYEPGLTVLMNDTGMPKNTLIRALASLVEKKVIERIDGGKGKRTSTRILYAKLTSPKMKLVPKRDRSQNETTTSPKMGIVTSPKMELQPKKETKEITKEKTASQNSLRLSSLWYAKSPPSEKHDKETLIKKWALEIDKAQRLTGYSDDQMRTAIEFRNRTPFWLKNCTKPNRLHPLRDGTRKIVTIYDQAAKDSPPQKSEFKEATTADFF